MRQPSLFYDAINLDHNDAILVLNSAADPFISFAIRQIKAGSLVFAEDNVASLDTYKLDDAALPSVQHVAFHDYFSHAATETSDVALMNLLYQPSNTWMYYGLRLAAYALRVGGRLYVVGAKDRGILTVEKRMRDLFGNVTTLLVKKGQRVLCSVKRTQMLLREDEYLSLQVFADNKLDEGTRLLLEQLDVRATDNALDIGCGAGFIGIYVARHASQGHVTMVDVSQAAVATARQAVDAAGLQNVAVLAGDATHPVRDQHFSLVVTNPPFHQGGVQTIEIAERFIREAASVLLPQGRLYLVANRFLRYESALKGSFRRVEEVGGDSRYKVLRASIPFINVHMV